jgi:hypothetical protein
VDDLGHFWAEISGLFTSLWPAAGSMRPNRAGVTPIGQQNPPRPLKLVGLRGKKQAKNTVFYFTKNTSIFSVCMYFLVEVPHLHDAQAHKNVAFV